MRVLISTLLGLEAFVSQELQDQGYPSTQLEVHDGRVYINQLATREALSQAVAIANIHSRCAERVFVELIYEEIRDFDALFSSVLNFPWESILPKNSAFTVDRGYSRKSELYGIPAIQGMIKKAIVRRLLLSQGKTEEDILIEDASLGHTKLHFSFMNNKFSLCVDTSGDGLHKRAYRLQAGAAPIKETLAAALVYMARYKPFSEEAMYDPFCGSGTILIEAAQIAAGIAPGLRRSFAAEELSFIDREVFASVRSKAIERARQEHIEDVEEPILFGSDIDEEVLEIAKQNAERAGVGHLIAFYPQNALELRPENILENSGHEKVLIVTNPPYGERLMDERALDILLQAFSKMFFTEKGIGENLRLTLITSELSLESILGFEADKRRKLYNGMIECTAYQYFKETGKVIQKKNISFTQVKKVLDREKSSFKKKEAPVSFDREKKAFDRERKLFEREKKAFDRERKPFDREKKAFDRERKPFDREKKAFDRERKPFVKKENAFLKEEVKPKKSYTSGNYDLEARRNARREDVSQVRGTDSRGANLARSKKPRGF